LPDCTKYKLPPNDAIFYKENTWSNTNSFAVTDSRAGVIGTVYGPRAQQACGWNITENVDCVNYREFRDQVLKFIFDNINAITATSTGGILDYERIYPYPRPGPQLSSGGTRLVLPPGSVNLL